MWAVEKQVICPLQRGLSLGTGFASTEPQPRKHIMQYSIIFVGLDVHKDPIDIALADEGRNGEIRFYGTIGRGRYGVPSYDYQTSILTFSIHEHPLGRSLVLDFAHYQIFSRTIT
jgi:hypothetical protein